MYSKSNVFSNLFHQLLDIQFQFFATKRYGNIRTETPLLGVQYRLGIKKLRLSTNISLYLESDTR